MDLPYKIISELGNQKNRKFGKVLLVEHVSTGHWAIMKIFFKNQHSENLEERIRQEANFSFDFDGLPKVIELIESEKEIILIKEYQKGIPLLKFWEEIKPKERLKTLLLLLDCLIPIFQHLKEKNIVHCDIKPSNILIEKQENKIKVHLIDFGIALNMDETNKRKTLFPLGYAAPELILNQLDIIDHRSDLFSLGIVIWRLFAGKLPLTHPNPSVFTNLQITYPLPDCPELNKQGNQILKKMCAKYSFKNAPNNMDPQEVKTYLLQGMNLRYSSLDVILHDFQHVSNKKPWYKLI